MAGTGYDAVVEQVEGTHSTMLKLILLGAAACMVAGVTLGYLKKRRQILIEYINKGWKREKN